MVKNERITENYVRQKFEEFAARFGGRGAQVIVEEQRSANPRIQRSMKSASKSGSGGAGSPEFIVSFPGADAVFGGQPLVVCECKADGNFHRSANLDRPQDYAVDGVLHYASHLAEEFTVVAVAVSGQTDEEMVVDSFLVPCGVPEPEDLGADGLLDFASYINIVKDKEHEIEVGGGDADLIAECSSELNETMRSQFRFDENQRSLAVAGILLALEDLGFRNSYKDMKSPAELADLITSTIYKRLKRDSIDTDKSGIIAQTYGFLNTNTKILEAGGDEGLRNLVGTLEDTVRPFMRSNRRYDLIGKFYNNFLKFANGDGGLGIVLTPQHMTELFVDLAEVHKDSVVMDICCGTGGFLISAMEKMETLAAGDGAKIADIREHQLVGVEANTTMFCLACSNMMLRGDGKSNIFQSDCFAMDKGDITRFKPTVALLNPPYSDAKQPELAFVEAALDMLEPNGKAVALVPVSCAMTTKKANAAVKKRILKKHTLVAVMSLPDQLFYDSDKSAVTCIMVFEAHKPHGETHKTWFANWKDDGFKESKRFGRHDAEGRYEKNIRGRWLKSYHERKNIKGFSLLKQVGSEDEWLAEAYLDTDFSSLRDHDFVETLLCYTTFLYANRLADKVSAEPQVTRRKRLDHKKWRQVGLGELFDVKGSRTTHTGNLGPEHTGEQGTRADDAVPHVTTQSANNGVRSWRDAAASPVATETGGVLVIESAIKGFCSYQPLDFTASEHVEKLVPKEKIKDKMCVETALFLTTVINLENHRYSYGRKMNQEKIANTKIKLPHTNDGNIDWKYMADYIKGLPYSKHLLPYSKHLGI